MENTIRVAEHGDAEAVAQILRRSISEVCHLDHQGDANILDRWLANKTAATVTQWLASPRALAVVAVSSGDEPVGIGMLDRSGEVLLCYVLPEVLGQGAGHSLLRAMLQAADDWKLKRVFLESTETARSFYLRNGFEPAGEPILADGLRGYPMQRQLTSSHGVEQTARARNGVV